MTSRVFIVAPHHDDECFGCGGITAKLRSQGWEVHIVVIFAPLEGIESIAGIKRHSEASAAADLMGTILHPDLAVPCRTHIDLEAITWQLVKLLREIQPEVLLIPHANERDPEHQAVHRAGIEASWLSASPFREQLGPMTTGLSLVLGYEIWTAIERPSLIVDISGFLQAKLNALRCYNSQLELINLLNAAEGLAKYRGAMFGGCAAAEAFSILRIHEKIALNILNLQS